MMLKVAQAKQDLAAVVALVAYHPAAGGYEILHETQSNRWSVDSYRVVSCLA